MRVSVLGAVPVGVYVTWHVVVALVPVRAHGEPVNVPAPLLDTVTCPPGGMKPPTSVSVTVTVHVAWEPVFTGEGTHVMVVDVERAVTVRLTVLLVLLE